MAIAKYTGRRMLAMEALEERSMLAGNIAATLDFTGHLVINGDTRDNGVEIRQLGTGNQVVIKGIEAGGQRTTINGQSAVVLNGVTNGIEVQMFAGNDTVKVLGNGNTGLSYFSGRLAISTGEGVDMVNFSDAVVKGDLLIGTNNGSENETDNVSLFNTRIGDFSTTSPRNYARLMISTGGGSDNVNLNQVSVRDDAFIFTDFNNDDLASSVDRVNINDVTVVFGDLMVITGNGSDQVSLNWVSVRDDLTINTGDRNDTVQLRDVVADEIMSNLGNGNDVLEMTNTRARIGRFDGGLDYDTFKDLGGNSLGIQNKQGFEFNMLLAPGIVFPR